VGSVDRALLPQCRPHSISTGGSLALQGFRESPWPTVGLGLESWELDPVSAYPLAWFGEWET